LGPWGDEDDNDDITNDNDNDNDKDNNDDDSDDDSDESYLKDKTNGKEKNVHLIFCGRWCALRHHAAAKQPLSRPRFRGAVAESEGGACSKRQARSRAAASRLGEQVQVTWQHNGAGQTDAMHARKARLLKLVLHMFSARLARHYHGDHSTARSATPIHVTSPRS
jgi:hypothetical protein